MASLVAPCPALHPRGSSMDCKRRRRHGGDDASRASKMQAVGCVASPVAHLSCARIRLFVQTSRRKQETQVTARAVRGGAHDVINKQNTGESVSCKKIEPAAAAAPPRPKKETSSSAQVSVHAVAHGVITKPKAGENTSCTRIRPTVAVQPSGLKDKLKVPCAGVLQNDAHGVIKTKQEAGERVQATATKSIPQIRPPAPAANHQGPSVQQDALRAALAAARQVRDRRQNVYERQREEARRELAKVVQTVFFNDPYISVGDVFKP